jgi:hypothetical protein
MVERAAGHDHEGVVESVTLPVRRGPRATELARALDAAAAAVAVAHLPRLEVALTRSRRYSGGYDHAGRIELSRHAEHLGLALLHELGHAVDHLVLGRGSTWGSESTRLRDWRRAVRASEAYGRLARVCTAAEAAYWSSPREAFARSFAQWTAARAGDDTLLRELERRAAGAGRQWTAADFAPVGRALDAVLA